MKGNRIKGALLILLCVLTFLAVLPATAFAAQETKTVYVQVNSFTNGNTYLIVNSSDTKALTFANNNFGTVDITGKVTSDPSVVNGNFIYAEDVANASSAEWQAETAGSGFSLYNSTARRFLQINKAGQNYNLNAADRNQNGRYWIYGNTALRFYRTDGRPRDQFNRSLSYNNGFTTSGSNSTIYIFEKRTITVTTADSITVDPTEVTLTEGATCKLTATTVPAGLAVTWESSDTNVASVDSNGTVTAHSAGTATITAKSGQKTATCAVTVESTKYVIQVDRYALSTAAAADHQSGNVTYKGLKGQEYDGTSDPTDDILWSFIPVTSGNVQGYYIMNGGKYLNASGTTLKLDSTPDVWKLTEGSTPGYFVDGTKIQSTAAGKGLKHFMSDDNIITVDGEGDSTSTTEFFTVVFNSRGGTAVATQHIAAGDDCKATKPDDPSKTGWSFAGWSTSDTAYAPFEFDSTISGSMTLYAVWQKTVNFICPSGITITCGNDTYTDDTEDKTKTITEFDAQSLTVSAAAATGYEFVNWEITRGTGNVTESTENPYTVTDIVDGMTVKAIRQLTEYTITLTLAGGSLGEDESETLTYTADSESFDLPTPTRDNYDFAGWTGTGLNEATQTVTIAKGSTGDRTYTATWTPTEYAINYDLDDGALATGVTNPEKYTIESDPITLNNPSKTGYTFAGWTGTGLSGATQNVTIPTGSSGTRSYTATWTPTEYSITYDTAGGSLGEGVSNPGTYTIETENFTLNNPTKEGYTFAGWTGTGLSEATQTVTIAKGSTGDRTYTATWTPTEYAISYDLDDGALATGVTNPEKYTIESDPITLNNPSKTGYTFAGWTGTGLSGATQNVTIPTGSSGTRSYVANWTANTYTVTFDKGAEDATGNMADQTFTYDKPQTLAPNGFTRPNYSFVNWLWPSAEGNGGTTYTDVQEVVNLTSNNNGRITLYAQWQEKPVPSVTVSNPGGLAYDGNAKAANVSVTVNSETVPAGDYTVTYYSDPEYKTEADPINAGTYYVKVEVSETDSHASTSGTGTITIAKAPMAITVNGSSTSKTYTGVLQTYTGDVTPTSETAGFNANNFSYSGSKAASGTNVSDYETALVEASCSYDDNNYQVTWTIGTPIKLTITKASLTVTANNNTITYGEVPAGNGVSYSGFVNNEDESVLGGTLTYNYDYSQYDNVGDSYKIKPSGLTSDNYEIGYADGTLKVEPKEVTLSWENTSLTYNGTEQAPTATAGGLVNNDSCTVTVSGGEINAGENYTATATGLSNSNYKLPDEKTQSFSIGQKEVGLEWSDTKFTYDGEEHVPTATATGLVDGDECEVTVEGAQTEVGTYTATATELSNPNYKLPEEGTTTEFTISKKESGGEPQPSGNQVTVKDSENGTVTSNREKANPGTTVKITVTPDEGYEVDSVTVTDKDGNEIPVTDNGDGTYSFTMPDSRVNVSATFKKESAPVSPISKFKDVDPEAWYAEGVEYAVTNGLMNGVSTRLFDPNGDLSRAMLVTILYRLEGEPSVEGLENPFTDVAEGTWYTDAVKWATANDIVKGYGNGEFGPSNDITREQIAAIMMRYAEYKGADTSDRADISGFTDASEVSDWAYENMQWANAVGLINGRGNNMLVPQGNTTRAETATILMRFCENIL